MNDIKTNYYRILTATIMYDKTLNPIEILLYAEITGLLESSGECFASNQYFAERFNRSETTISTILHKLEKKGYIMINVDRKNNNKRVIFLSEPLLKNQNTSFEKSKEPLLKNQKSYIYNNRELITELNKEKINKKEEQDNDFEKQMIISKEEILFEDFYKVYNSLEEIKDRTRTTIGYNKTKDKFIKQIKRNKTDFNDVLNGTKEYIQFIKFEHKRGFNRALKDIDVFINQCGWEGDKGISWREKSNNNINSTMQAIFSPTIDDIKKQIKQSEIYNIDDDSSVPF